MNDKTNIPLVYKDDKSIPIDGLLKSLIKDDDIQEIKILVGFFYFSSYHLLYETLKERYDKGKIKEGFIKILVGMGVDRSLYEIVSSLNNNDNNSSIVLLDKENIDKIEFFKTLLRERKIIIKQTKDVNHAKFYLFKARNIKNNKLIIGSSNLSKVGLEVQGEYNVFLDKKSMNKFDNMFNEMEMIFDREWNEATDKLKIKENLLDELDLQDQFLLKPEDPFIVWTYLIKLYIDHKTKYGKDEKKYNSVEEIFKLAGYKPYKYQIDAVLEGANMLLNHNGVLLADVVGLGKSVIASAIAKFLGEKGIIICRPHLIGNSNYGWRKYVKDFKLSGWEVFSSGKLEDAINYLRENKIDIVIIDEAHKFRNEKTQSYKLLSNICRGRKVVLITATPFNNKPDDIYALLKLFTIPAQSSIILGDDLYKRFKEYSELFNKKKNTKEYSKKLKEIADEIKAIIEPIVIRRNRLDLQILGEKVDVPKVNPPEPIFYELSKEQSEFYDWVLEKFNRDFKAAIYLPENYLKDKSKHRNTKNTAIYSSKKYLEEESNEKDSKNLPGMIKRLLVKRFESSFDAFYKSLENLIEKHRIAIKNIEEGRIYSFRDVLIKLDEDFEEETQDKEIEKLYDMNDIKQQEFLTDVKNDLKLLKEIRERLEKSNLLNEDPKIKKLIEKIKEHLNDRKILIFTEYEDTANYLEKKLKEVFKDKVLSVVGKNINQKIQDINNNFNAEREDEGKYSILISTDRLSEGVNLHRCGVVINYDIPWNPVRVIQRVGRINRIGKKVYDEIYILNFFPTQKGESINKQVLIAQTKIFMIHQILHEDSQIISPDETPSPSDFYKNLSEEEKAELSKKIFERINKYEEEESFYTKIIKEYEEIKNKYPEIVKYIENLSITKLYTAKTYKENGLVAIIKRSEELFVVEGDVINQSKINFTVSSFRKAYEKLKAEYGEKTLKPNKDSQQAINEIVEYINNIGSDNSFELGRDKKKLYKKTIDIIKTLKEQDAELLKKLLKEIKYKTLPESFYDDIKLYTKNKDISRFLKFLRDKGFDLRDFKEPENKEKQIIIIVENRKSS